MQKPMVITVIPKKSKKVSKKQAERDFEVSRQWQPYFKWLKQKTHTPTEQPSSKWFFAWIDFFKKNLLAANNAY